MSTEKGQSDGAPKGKLRVLSREEKQRLANIMLDKELDGDSLSDLVIEERKAADKKMSASDTSESPDNQEAQGLEVLPPNSLIHQAFKKYGEPTMSREELGKMLDKELNGESLSDFLIQDRRKKPY